MLYFSKLKILFIYVVILFLSYFSISNFLYEGFKPFNKEINLGLDLQGGSYLLLEVDTSPIVLQKIQTKFTSIKKFFRENDIKFSNIKIQDQSIYFDIEEISKDKFISEFTKKKDNQINTYFEKYKEFEFLYEIDENEVLISFSKFGIIEIKNVSIVQS